MITFLYYLFAIAIYAVPMMFMQSFLGQFSSSGYVSVFRIAPFFKGLGYVILLLNFMVLTFVVIFAAVPMFYAVTSVFSWSSMVECRNNTWNTPSCTALTVDMDYDTNIKDYSEFQSYRHLPSYEFYRWVCHRSIILLQSHFRNNIAAIIWESSVTAMNIDI